MHYVVHISREGKHLLAEFPDCDGCQTFADNGDELAQAAREALEGWLEAHLVDGQIPPRPRPHRSVPSGKKRGEVSVRPGLAAALEIRWARQDAGLTQKALGERACVSQQQIAKLEDPDENPSLETLDKVGRALGLELAIAFDRPAPMSMPRLARTNTARRERTVGRRAR